MSDLARRYAVVTALVTAAFLAVAGCATLRAPVGFESPEPQSDSALRLEVIEGRPNGLLLELRMEPDAPEQAAALHLLRADAGGDAELYREIQLSDAVREALAEQGIEFLDRNVAPGRSTRYQLRLVDREDAPLAYSELLQIQWREPPARPTGLRSVSTTPSAVELRWKSPPGYGAVIFRRNVLHDQSTPKRIAEVRIDSSGVFVDDDVEPGVVYAYRISLAAHHGDFRQLGPPSEPIYVDIPQR